MTGGEPVDSAAHHSMPALTGLRGLCALWVLVYHAWVYATPKAIVWTIFDRDIRAHVILSIGWAGVQVLFVLSAFLLTLPYVRANAGLAPGPRPLRYLSRRVARVFPAYYFQLFILVVLAWLLAGKSIVGLAELPRYLLMLFIPPPIGLGSPASINGVWWTLPIELSFYLLLPLIYPLASWKNKWRLLGVCLLVTVAWRWFVLDIIGPEQKPLWVAQMPGSMDSFGAGMLGAVLYVHCVELRRNYPAYVRTLRALLYFTPPVFFVLGHWMAESYLSYWTISPIMFLWTPIFSTAVIVLILNCANGSRFLDMLLANRGVFYLGIVSYGLYLWHAPAGKWLLTLPWIRDMPGYQFPPLLARMFACALLAATVSWYLVEKPSIARAHRPPAD